MSTTAEVQSIDKVKTRTSWALWGRQVMAILRLEVKKNFWGKRAFLIYLLAFAPVLLMAAVAVFETADSPQGTVNFGEVNVIFANIYEGLILRTVIFFGCAWIFMNLFRGEVVDKSLHYYFLAPVRREVLVAGKYFSGLVTSLVLFMITTVGSLFFMYFVGGVETNLHYLTNGPGVSQALTYAGITILACFGYGAIFLVMGLFFRNPMIPAIVAYGWEWINFLLPPVLKKISIIHYLHSLSPVPVSEGPFALVAEPTSAWLSVPGLLIVTAIALLFASYQIRRMEIKYGGD
jgi:ABC-type transport system involved in multi-copper enzyme maturation permease subunit